MTDTDAYEVTFRGGPADGRTLRVAFRGGPADDGRTLRVVGDRPPPRLDIVIREPVIKPSWDLTIEPSRYDIVDMREARVTYWLADGGPPWIMEWVL